MSKIDFEFIERILTKLDYSYGKKQTVHDKIFEKINKNKKENRISINVLDSVAGGSNPEALSKDLNDLENKD